MSLIYVGSLAEVQLTILTLLGKLLENGFMINNFRVLGFYELIDIKMWPTLI